MNELRNEVAMGAETRLERQRCIAAVDAEPELPGDMPDEMWEAVRNNREVMAEALRLVVRQTKEGIKARINGGT